MGTVISMYENWGETFDHVPPAVAAFAEWYLTLPEEREDDEKTASAWASKYGHSKSWVAGVQREPEWQRFIAAKSEAMGFTKLHFQAVWENYFRQAANSNDFRAARNFLLDTGQIQPAGIGVADPDAAAGDEPPDEELERRHREKVRAEVMAELAAAPKTTDTDPEGGVA